MSETAIAIGATSYLLSIGAWAIWTAPYLKENGLVSNNHFPTFLLFSITDFLKAIYVAVFRNRELPPGVFVHGVLLFGCAYPVFAS